MWRKPSLNTCCNAQVFANDLNPDSFLYLQKNTHLNKVRVGLNDSVYIPSLE